MERAIFCLAKNADHADRIVKGLLEVGFNNEDISVLLSDKEGKLQGNLKNREERTQKKGTLAHEKHTKAPEGGVTGATAGGIIGGSIGLLAGVGSLAIPGLGILIAAGPLLGALSGSAVGGALGLLIGTLVGMGIPEYEAKKYESQLKSGGVLICLHVKDGREADLAKETLKNLGAKDISTSIEKAGKAY